MFYSPRIENKDYSTKEKQESKFTQTIFIPNPVRDKSGQERAVTGTDHGDIIVWDQSLIIEGIGEQNEKRLIKVVTFN